MLTWSGAVSLVPRRCACRRVHTNMFKTGGGGTSSSGGAIMMKQRAVSYQIPCKCFNVEHANALNFISSRPRAQSSSWPRPASQQLGILCSPTLTAQPKEDSATCNEDQPKCYTFVPDRKHASRPAGFVAVSFRGNSQKPNSNYCLHLAVQKIQT